MRAQKGAYTSQHPIYNEMILWGNLLKSGRAADAKIILKWIVSEDLTRIDSPQQGLGISDVE
jgi:hypothetical protein